MNAATVSRVMDLIPDRVARSQSGAAFADISATSCEYPERLALLVEFLHWLSPIYPTTKDDQARLGLFAPHKQVIAEAEMGEEEDDLEIEGETIA
jgi:hypothetical protein